MKLTDELYGGAKVTSGYTSAPPTSNYARSNEAQRDFRRSAPSNEYISINVSRVSFESSASRNMKCHLLEHIARHTHEHTHTHDLNTIENGLDRDRVETLLLYEDIITKNTLFLIIFHEFRSKTKSFL
ncbi:hypothetical protein ALC53_08512 [Atta colombica]|uniref:Uncharacterized protein n=1 Tax=Atta colombica TaxID=520822 RepID=A0A195BAE9_9HYME|nr:hypothetical protein ALC53_08512 [Atta colombica]